MPVPFVTSTYNNQLLKKGAWKKKNEKKKRTQIFFPSQQVSREEPWCETPGTCSGTQQHTCSSAAVHPCRVGHLYAGSWSSGCSRRAGGTAEGCCPWAGCCCCCCTTGGPHTALPGLILRACLPPSPAPSHRDVCKVVL